MKRVVVTGGLGMVGHALVPKLYEAGYYSLILDNCSREPTRRSFNHWRRWSPDECEANFIDVTTDEARLYYEGASAVINLAADVGGVFYNQDNNIDVLNRNVALQTIPIQHAELAGVETFIQFSSVCTYGQHDPLPYREDAILTTPWPANLGYTLAKRVGERMVMASSIPRRIVVRPTNISGKYDYFDGRSHVIPALVKRAAESIDHLDVFASINTTRQFISPDDVATAVVALLEKGESDMYNIALPDNRNTTTLYLLADIVCHVLGIKRELVFYKVEGGELDRRVNAEKLQGVVDLSGGKSLEAIVEDVVSWYRESGGAAV